MYLGACRLPTEAADSYEAKHLSYSGGHFSVPHYNFILGIHELELDSREKTEECEVWFLSLRN